MKLEWRRVQCKRRAWTIERTGHTALQIGGRVYIEGGYSNAVDRTVYQPQHCVMDVRTLKYRRLYPTVAEGTIACMSYYSATLVDGQLLLLGGKNEVTDQLPATFTVRWFDPVLNTVTSPACRGTLPLTRKRHVAGFMEHRREVMVFGGITFQQDTLNDLWAVHVDKMEFYLVGYKGQVPSNQASHMAVTDGRRMYMYCHRDRQVFVLDCRRRVPQWSSTRGTGDVPRPVFGGSLTLYEGKLIMFGGVSGGVSINDLYVYDLATQAWTKADNGVNGDIEVSGQVFPQPIARHLGIKIKSKIVFIGGTFQRLDDMWQLHIS